MRKNICSLFLVILSLVVINKQFIRLHKLMWRILGKFMIISLTHKGSLETLLLGEKGYFFSNKRFWSNFFSFCRTTKMSGNRFWQFKKTFNNFCSSFKMLSHFSRNLEVDGNKFVKLKAIVPLKKRFWPLCSHITNKSRHWITFKTASL